MELGLVILELALFLYCIELPPGNDLSQNGHDNAIQLAHSKHETFGYRSTEHKLHVVLSHHVYEQMNQHTTKVLPGSPQ